MPVPFDTYYQTCQLASTENATVERVIVDSVGNRCLVFRPKNPAEPVEFVVKGRMKPIDLDVRQVDSVPYTYPPEYECYRGITKYGRSYNDYPDFVIIDPTTKLAGEYAELLRGRTRSETLANVSRWTFFHKMPLGPAPALGGSEAEFEGYDGACGGMTDAVCAILRRLGFAARPVSGYSCWTTAKGPFGPGEGPLGHAQPEYWEPAFNTWILFCGGSRIGSFPTPGYLPMVREQLAGDGSYLPSNEIEYRAVASEHNRFHNTIQSIRLTDSW
jgi:hypothetical protein